jgi:hypothetical protein
MSRAYQVWDKILKLPERKSEPESPLVYYHFFVIDIASNHKTSPKPL